MHGSFYFINTNLDYNKSLKRNYEEIIQQSEHQSQVLLDEAKSEVVDRENQVVQHVKLNDVLTKQVQ